MARTDSSGDPDEQGHPVVNGRAYRNRFAGFEDGDAHGRVVFGGSSIVETSARILLKSLGLSGKATALVVIESHSTPSELLAKNPVLLAKVIDDLQLVLVHPPADGDQHEAEWIQDSRHR